MCVTAVLLVVALVVVYCFSPDFSETVAEFLSSLVDQKGVDVKRDMSYVTPQDVRRVGDLYSSTVKIAARPAIVIVHGGSWSQGSKRDFPEVGIARYFARNGYAAFNIDYRLLPTAGEFPADIVDVKDAVCFLAANAHRFSIDPGRIFVLGTSSGASAALVAAYTSGTGDFLPQSGKSCLVAAVASISGPTDFEEVSANPYVQEYLHTKGKAPPVGSLRKASPLSYVQAAVPTILVHGTEDHNVPIAQALELERRLKELKVPVSLVRVEGQSHFIGASSRRQCLDFVLRFFSQIHGYDHFSGEQAE
jgi:acetyl esterase/lipase